MDITMLGTGSALVTECYNTCFVLSDGDEHFLVDGGGGNGILSQLKKAGFNWQDMRTIFVTHKHMDHILGAVWMIRMICQHMKKGSYEGEAVIYGHDEVIALLREMAMQLLNKKETVYIGDRLHLVEVNDGDTKEIMGKRSHFLILVQLRQSNLDSVWIWVMARKLRAAETSLTMIVRRSMREAANGCSMRHSACILRRIYLIHTRNITQQSRMPVNLQKRLKFRICCYIIQRIKI